MTGLLTIVLIIIIIIIEKKVSCCCANLFLFISLMELNRCSVIITIDMHMRIQNQITFWLHLRFKFIVVTNTTINLALENEKECKTSKLKHFLISNHSKSVTLLGIIVIINCVLEK